MEKSRWERSERREQIEQRVQRTEHYTQMLTQQVESTGVERLPITSGRPGDPSPPIFEQIFKNARFAQGGNAKFEGKLRGNPTPVVSWTRKKAPLVECNKYSMSYNEQTGDVSLLIKQIGPGDEGEYTCTARNQYGEAICSVYIQPEGVPVPAQQSSQQQSYRHVSESVEHKSYGTQGYSSEQSRQSQRYAYTNGSDFSSTEDFKVDTFEYRLLREVSFRETITKRYIGETDIQISTEIDKTLGPVSPPKISQKPRNSKLQEGTDAQFQVQLSGNPRPRVTWFKNGQRIVNSNKHNIITTNNQTILRVRSTQKSDSGHYTLLAENPNGCIVTSAYLAVESPQETYVQDQKSQYTIDTQQVETERIEVSEKALAPQFVKVCQDRDVTEGKMTRFDCRVTGRPYPEVTWFINERQIRDDYNHKILVNESGNHALMITNVDLSDSGVVTCVARNKSGETSFQCRLNVIEKEQVVAPKFIERFNTLNVREGEPVRLNARAVGTPTPRITWQKDGVPIIPNPELRINTEGGASTLDIPRAKASDAAWYQCTAQNVAGSTATRARLYVEVPKEPPPEQKRLHLPRPTKIIEPEPAPGPEIIYLRHVERARPYVPPGEEDRVYPPPQFIVPLKSVTQMEGGKIHFETRIEPVGDPTMKIEWLKNGQSIEASSRFTSIFRFGYISLDMLSLTFQDSGEYTCRAVSATGMAETKAMLQVTPRATIERTSQHPESLQYIQQLEDYSKYQHQESVEEQISQKPQFIRPLQDLGELQEGRNAHFEAQLTPVSDPTMRVEWYKDGKSITASSRITAIFNFGYVSLNIMHLRAEDAGSYTVRAVNRLGEAISTASIRVAARSTVTGDLGIPEQRRYIEKTEQLEAYQQQQHQKYYQEIPESTQRPEFKTPIRDQVNIKEGGFAHFEARLEPVGDSTLRVEWLKDGRPVEASSRSTTFFNFGYVALTIKSVTIHDAGNYVCRAYNALGQATTNANLTIITKKDIIAESQHPGGLEKIQYLEDSSKYSRRTEEEVKITQKPRFLGPLKGTNKIVEGQSAHFEARVEPQSDLTMVVEWYFNGKLIKSANRIQTYHDFGYVALDITNVRAEDSGVYTVVARNASGEAQLSASMVVETRSSIDTSSIHRGLYEKTRQMEESKFVEPMYHIEEISKSKPVFVQPLSDPQPISEGKNIHLECRLEPMGDPTMRVEWFHNGRAVTVGSRFKTYYDFGFVALDIIHATSADSGEYTVRAVNHLGSAHTSAMVRVIEKSDILTDTQNEQAVEQIQILEDAARRTRQVQEDITVMQAPQFVRPLHNIETVEGTNVHLECRLQPIGDPTMKVEWFCNGKPIKTGHRFRPAYEFDYVALDLLSVYPEDSGVYTCQATNQLGEAVTSCALRVVAKKDLIFESQHPSGLEKIQYLEDASRYKKTDIIDESINIKPRFVTKPKSIDNVIERNHVHFECKLEPVTDSNLKVEWFKNGQPVTIGHRFRPIHDFGYVALDIIDLIAEDSGVYTCRAVNLIGSDEVSCRLTCRETADIIRATQNEAGLGQIQVLEDRSKYQRTDFVDEITTQAPIFTTSLKNVDIKEGQRAHFECRLIPVSDATMKVEWYHNNKPLKSGSRFTETNSFGFVALDIMSCLPEDSGTYTCRAINALGEAVTSGVATIHSRKSIYLESQHEGALSRLNQLEDSSRHQRQTTQEEFITQAPMFTMPMKDIRVAENQAVHFEARLIPVGDPKLRVEWLRNGVAIEASNRITTMHDFGYVALNMKYVNPEDSGTYTCRAINELGEAVTSSTLFVQSKASLQLESQHEAALQKIQQLEDSSRYQRKEEIDVAINQAPRFITQLNGPSKLVEGQSAHYECRIEPYPDSTMRVEWYFNGKVLQSGHRYRTAYDFGFAALDILTVYGEDSGEYTCKVINKLGQATSSINLSVQSKESIIRDTQHESALQKIQYLEDDSRYKRVVREDGFIAEKPQFGKPLKNVHVAEGLPVHLEATLTPVNDPTMRVEWYCNGRPIPQGHRFKSTYDFGYVALDVLYAYSEDSGTYMCKATNAVGEAVTTSSVNVDAKASLYLDTLDEQRLRKIKELEQYERPKLVEEEQPGQRPIFLTALTSLENLKEGDRAHFECRVEPVNDPDLKIEWFLNGKKIKTGHRFRTTHDFGYVALDILYSYAEDSGTYMCKATNKLGEAVNTCTLKVASHRNIILDTQHPNGLEKIRQLEAQGHTARIEVEEPKLSPPRFVTELRGTTHVYEGQTAHFECQVEPVHDPNLRIEFYHNGKALQSASRFHITFDFGYVSLDIQHCVPEDAGEYSVKAINALGQCTSAISMTVTAKGSIISESQRPEGLEKIRELESAEPFKRPEIPEPVTRQRPVFTQPLQNIDNIQEGQTAHFDCRLIPVGDPTLKVEWFRNEKLIEDSSRITKTHDFGYVSMVISHVRDEDEGVYMCRASNLLGEAVTTAAMRIRTKAAIQMDTQHPEGMKKIQKLEEPVPRKPDEPEREFEKPIFTQVLTGPTELWEGQHAHYEARVVPVGDPSMRFEWFINGVELKMGSRFRTTHDFGFVTLDINSVVSQDEGIYMCKAINNAGSTVSSTSLKVKTKSTIVDEAQRPEAWQQIQMKEAAMNKVPEMFIDTGVQQAPIFTTHLKSYDKLVEGQHVYLEAQVEPRTDPNLRIEWFKNGVSLTTGARLKSTFDFGLVTLSINSLRYDDSGIYTCKATNLMGEAVSTASIKIEDRHWLLGDSLHPESLDRIGALEQPKPGKPESPEPVYETPVFITHLNNIICKEGDNIHFECNVEPSRDPTLKIEWFFNNKLLPSGTRYKSIHDFSYVSLDITHTYEEDSGIYTCKATNSKGSATTSGTLRCTGDKNIYLDTQHPQGKAGLEAVEQAEEARLAKGRRPSVPEADYPKPEWVVPVAPEHELIEGQPLHLEGQVEPKNDPNLKIEWYFNGKVLEHGSRFKLSSDFGFVTLDLTDVYERDSGIYTCKAYNKRGEAFTSSTIYCISKENLIERTQHPKGKEGLEKIQNLEDSLQREPGQKPDDDTGRPPEFVTVFQDITDISEGQIAHYEATLIPTGDQSMVIEWFYNGKTIEASHRIRTVYAFGMVVLEILGTKMSDSGVYSCRATNRWGTAEISVKLECVDKSKGQKPRFTTHIQNIEGLKDGQSAHFECTVVPVDDPEMVIEWYHNGQPLRHSNRIKTISDFGFVVLDIAYTQNHDTGEYVCRAYNKYGEDFTKATISCYGRGGVYTDSLQPDSLAKIRELESLQGMQQQAPAPASAEPPRFITQIQDLTKLVEGQSAHFEARLVPVDDPDLKVEWFYNGKKLPHGHRYRTFHDFGIVILDILYCYEENSGEYECVATNKLGRDSTKATLKCTSKENLILDSQLPRGMEGGLEKLQTLEDSMIRRKDTEVEEKRGKAPVFTVPLSNIENLREGENAHFEARLTPTDDPNLKVEWYWNGKSLKAGSRFRTFCDFGFVILEISPTYPEDSGEYLCRAYNNYGEAVTTATMKVQGKRNIILESQLPKGMEGTIDKIAALEGYTGTVDSLTPEAESGKPPEFVTTPPDLILTENSSAHFECRLIPVNDSSMTVEWFHNGKALLTGSRVKTINDFGFVILEIGGVYQRDAGLYTCKATNRHGEATVSCKLQVKGRQGIILEPQLPSQFKSGTESIQRLEETLHKRDEITIEDEKPNPPRFTVEIKDNLDINEGGPIHFDCRVEPVGDPTMRIDWFHNGRPFATGSRVHMLNDFGFIAMDIDYIYARDVGEYTCRATNKWGFATTTAKITCSTKRDIILESQLPQGMSGEKIKELERGRVSDVPKEEPVVSTPPKFITQIQSHTIEESESVRFECRVEPKEDPKLRIEWYRNGKLLPSGHRFRTVYDMGFVSLDILYVYSEDSGEYVCRAVNEFGEDFTKATVSCKRLPDIILQNQVPKGMKKSEALTQMEATIKKYTSEVFLTEDDLYDVDKKQPPRFVTQIQSQTTLVEMETTKFECQLAPVGDPNMKVEWFFNGKPLLHKNRFTPIYDFGYVAMNFGWVYPEDSGEYLCRATNLYGMDETRAVIKTAGKPGIVYDSQLPKHMKSIEKIREMEASWQVAPEQNVEETKPRSSPIFVSKPESVTVEEGEWARFCCRVTGHPKPRVMWLLNGNTIVNGSRYKLIYDGMYHFDIPKTRQYDTGKIEVIARSSVGEALATTELKVIPRHDDYRGVLKNAPRRIMGTKEYRKPEWVIHMEELEAALKATKSVPTFVQHIIGERVREEETVTFEAIYKGNPTPEITWYKDDEVIKTDEDFDIETAENRTICKIKKATKKLEGTYKCKAVSDIGMATTKAILQVFEADEKFEKIPTKRTKSLKTETFKEEKAQEVIDETLTSVTEAVVKPLESVKVTKKKQTVKEKANIKINEAEYVETTDIASFKKIEQKEEQKEIPKQIEPVVTPNEYLVSSQPQKDETVGLLEEIPKKQKGILKTVKENSRMVAEINELLEVINAKEFGPGESPLRELAKIGYMLRTGITTEQIESLYDSQHFPALRMPQSQSALVNLVERQGHGALITEVLTEETAQNEDVIAAKVGFRAFMKMVALNHTSVEEVIAHFYPEDFKPRAWEQKEAHEIIVGSSAEEIAKTSTIKVIKDTTVVLEEIKEELPEIEDTTTVSRKETIKEDKPNEIIKKKPKLKPITIVEKVMEESKPQFAESSEEPLFKKLKLKKAVIKTKPEDSVVKIPKIQLKSRIRYVNEWPPAIIKPNITFLGSIRQNGILSRNIKEASKIKKKVLKQPELPEFEKAELEKPMFTHADIVDTVAKSPDKGVIDEIIKISEPDKEIIDKKQKPSKTAEVEIVPEETTDVKPLEEEEEPENVTFKPRRPSLKKVEEIVDEVTIKKKLKPVRKSSVTLPEITEPEEVTFRPKTVKTKEDVEQEFNIQLDSYLEEEISMSSKVKLKPQRQPTFNEEANEASIQFYEEKDADDSVEIMEDVEEKEEDTNIIMPLKKPKKPISETSEELISNVIISKPKPDDKKTEIIEDVTFELGKKNEYVVDNQEISFDIKQQIDSFKHEDLSLSSNIKLAHKKKITVSEEADETSIRLEKEIEDDSQAEEVIISEAESEENVEMVIRRKPKKPTYEVNEVEELSVEFKPKRVMSQTFEEEELTISAKRKPKKPSQIQEAEATMSISKEQEFPETPVNVRCGDTVFAVYSYVAETDEAINLVEGERLYILETTNQDWWFVRKHLTEEKGWVPAQYLMDEANYTLYLQKKLNEKIDKLPVFEKPASEEQAVAPIFVEKLRPKHTPDGSTVQFECQVEGYPRPQITWFRQTAIIKPSQDFQMYYDDDNVATLVIREVFPEDAGTFTCVAKNAAGFASSTTELIVEAPLSDHGSEMTVLSRKSLSRESSLADILEGIPPTFSKRPKAQYVDEGSQIFLECRLVAIPEPDIAWFFKGEEIMPDENISVVTESDMHMYCSVLKISNVKKFQEGTYTVLAVNREGEASLPIVLKIRTGEKEKPQVIEPLKSMIIREGESFVLTTQVVGTPEPKVMWYKNNKPIKAPSQKSDENVHSITIIKPKKGKDDGVYTLKATNSEGSAETSAVITIEEPTEENAEPPLFINRFQELTVKEQGTIKLNAKVTGNPIPIITWYRNNQMLTPNETITQNFDGENIELIITNVDSEIDSGDYKCVAANSAGKASHGARVTIDVDKVTFVRNLKKRYETEEGKTVILECETSHTVSTKWYHNNKELSGMDHREIIQESRIHKLRIKKSKLTDKGTIKCVVKDQETSTELIVKETVPEFIRKLQDFEVKERDVAILEVEVNSETADVIWERDGETIKPKKNKYEVEKRGNVRKLFIRNTSVHDEGEYTCKLRDDTCTAEVTVVELPPEIITRLKDQKVNKGNKATFEIELTKGDALVRWFKDGAEIQFSNHIQLTIDGKKQKLKIYDCETNDEGVYACEVGNDKCTARLTVEEPSIDFTLRLPEVLVVPANTDCYLTVEIPDEELNVTWFRRKTVLEDTDKFTLISDGKTRTLIIRKCTEKDECEYSCQLLDTRCTTRLQVEVIEFPPKIVDYEKVYKVKKGTDTTLYVQYEANPQPNDEWVINSKIIKKSKHTKPTIDSMSASLTIKKLENNDAGIYKLRLENNCGYTEIEIEVIVLDIPSPPGKPSIPFVDDTSVNIFWSEPEHKGYSEIQSYIVEYQEENTIEWISIENIRKTQHLVENLKTKCSYRFRAFAVNEIGVSESSEMTEYIRIEKAAKPQPPTIEKPLKDLIGAPDDDIELTCIFGGIPEPKVTWFRNGKQLKTAKATYINRVASLIVTVSKTTEGHYKCVAINEHGEIETSCTVEMRQKPTITVSDEEIEQKHTVDDEWSVTAHIEGIPQPEVIWYRNSTRIEISEEIQIVTEKSSSVIRIRKLTRSHSGKYTVEAVNKAGSTSVETTLRVYDKPSKPQGPVIMREISRESVTIEWKPPLDDGGLDLIKYAIEKHEPELDQWIRVADVDKNIESYCIQKLNENCEYMFRILAQNPIGVSDALQSEPIVIKNALDVPSPPLGPLGFYGIDDNSVTITWYPSEKNGGTAILDYSIEIKQDGKKWKHVATTVDTLAKIEKLTKNVTYQFRICARNEIGTSLPYISEDKITIGKTLSAPSRPQRFVIKETTSRSVTLQWAAPESDGGSVVTNYIIEYKTVKGKSWSKIKTVGGSLYEYCIENIKEKDEILFRISAENAIGVSLPAESETVKLEKYATVPSPPTGPLEIRTINNIAITSWGTPEYDGGAPLLGYNIAIRDVTKTMWMEVGKVDDLKYHIKDLGENHTYMIRIYARNEIGLSEPLESEPFKVIPGEDSHADEEPGATETEATEPTSFSQTTTSWLRDNNMDADIQSYARGSLLRRDEYFFRIWHYAKQLFK